MAKRSGNSNLIAVYLHGFASGPSSSKAVFFSKRLSEIGIRTLVPDLNRPSFEKMTLTSQLQVVQEMIHSLPAGTELLLIGSSMGGLLATMQAKAVANLKALILLAPGFGLTKRWPVLFGVETINSWKEKGSIDVFHYAAGKNLPLSYAFFEDINKHQTDHLRVKVPTLLFHGKSDETVPIYESELFAERNAEYVELLTLDDDHQLLSSLKHMWSHSQGFLSKLQR